MRKHTPMDIDAAARIQSAAAENPDNDTADSLLRELITPAVGQDDLNA
ncbi:MULTISPECIES: hypothetical protein [unclassified Nonomuraea]|nr:MULTISPECIES: hypothetical protein [unclassified Nonomuraea]NBE98600.1 hypothetical protein [Nonomuraea sp. K271]